MDFVSFARAHGLLLSHAMPDGRWHRVPTDDHPRKRNGAYVYDGRGGACQNWALMIEVAVWRPEVVPKIDLAAERRRRQEIAAAERKRHQEAAGEAQRIIDGCLRARHPYLCRKGFPAALGLVHEDGRLVIPMRDYRDGELASVQTITAEGEKKFLTGGKARGSVLILGPQRGPRTKVLCEGFATGLSLEAAMRDLRRAADVVICFSAGNLQHIAEMIKPPAFVFADRDESQTGEWAAIATGLPWTMTPEFGDANDYHQAHGLRALVKFILEMT